MNNNFDALTQALTEICDIVEVALKAHVMRTKLKPEGVIGTIKDLLDLGLITAAQRHPNRLQYVRAAIHELLHQGRQAFSAQLISKFGGGTPTLNDIKTYSKLKQQIKDLLELCDIDIESFPWGWEEVPLELLDMVNHDVDSFMNVRDEPEASPEPEGETTVEETIGTVSQGLNILMTILTTSMAFAVMGDGMVKAMVFWTAVMYVLAEKGKLAQRSLILAMFPAVITYKILTTIILLIYGLAITALYIPGAVIIHLATHALGITPEHRHVTESALMLTGDDDAMEEYDRRNFKCKPFNGKKGVTWENFERDFTTAMSLLDDDDNDYAETLLGTDIGGDVWIANGGHNGVGNINLNAAQTRRRNKRNKKLFALLYAHVMDLRLRETMTADHNNDGRGAFIMLQNTCGVVYTDLEMFELDAIWDDVSIHKSIGRSAETVTLLARHLRGVNARRPQNHRKSEDDMTIKFLSCFDHTIDKALSLDSQKEIRAAAGSRMYENNGHRDFDAAVHAYDDIWRALFRAGAITAAPARRGQIASGVRPDGGLIAGDGDEDDALLAGGGNRRGEKARRPLVTRSELRAEPVCFVCRGFGHIADVCPSSNGFRALSDVIDALSALAANKTNGRRMPSTGATRNGKGRGNPRRNGRGRGNGLFVDADGVLYTADGVRVEEHQYDDDAPEANPGGPGPSSPPEGEDGTMVAADDDDESDDCFVVFDLNSSDDDTDDEIPDLIDDETDASDSDDDFCVRFAKKASLDAYRREPTIPPEIDQDRADREASARYRQGVNDTQLTTSELIKHLVLTEFDDPVLLQKFYDKHGTAADLFAAMDLADVTDDPFSYDSDRSADAPETRGFEAKAEAVVTPMQVSGTPRGVVGCDPGLLDRHPCSKSPAYRRIAMLTINGWRKLLMHGVLTILCLSLLGSARLSRPEGNCMHPPVMGIVPVEPQESALTVFATAARWASKLTGANMGLFYNGATNTDMIVDCGSTKHCVPDERSLWTIDDENPTGTVRVGNGKTLKVTKVGKMRITVLATEPLEARSAKKRKPSVPKPTTMILSNVLVVPEMPCRLFSCRWGYKHDGISTYLNDANYLRLPDGKQVQFKDTSKHYVIETALATSDSLKLDADLLHARLGHFSMDRINKTLATNKSTGHDRIEHNREDCDACMKNANRKPRPRNKMDRTEYKYFGERVCSDSIGPFPESPQGFTYAVNFYDCFSRSSATYYLKSPDATEVLRACQTWVKDHARFMTKTAKPGVPDEWFCDNGGEFRSNDMEAFCAELGTRRTFSVPYVPQRNSYAERLWGILLQPMRKMLAHAVSDKVKETFWPFLMTQADMIHNRLKSKDRPSAYSVLYGKEDDLTKFRVPLCDCFVSIYEHEIPGKLASVRVPAVHLGYDAQRRGYFVYIPAAKRITTSIDVDFRENSFTTLGELSDVFKINKRGHRERDLNAPVHAGRQPARATRPTTAAATAGQAAPPPAQPAPARVDLRYGGEHPDADTAAVAGYVKYVRCSSVGEVFLAAADTGRIPVPKNWKEAINDPIYGKRWWTAMTDDAQGKFKDNRAWELVKRIPPNHRCLKGKWVFAVIYNADGSVKKFKARWVGCGYSQVKGIDYDEAFCSTLRSESQNAFFAHAAANDDELLEVDVVKAFTQGDMDGAEIYVEQPHGLEDDAFAACRLLKPLEGTCQAGNLFMKSNANQMGKLGFHRSMTDPNIFWKSHDKMTVKVGIYVDNLIIAYPKAAAKLVDEFVEGYKARFKIEIRGEPSIFMGLQISRNRRDKTLTMHQENYIGHAHAQFLSSTCTKEFTTPVPTSKLDDFMKISTAQDDEERAEMKGKSYLALMGTLLWAVRTHPEINFYVSFLCQFMHDPSKAALEAGLAILSYLYHVRKHGITYDGSQTSICVYSDSSFGSSPKPFGGHVILYCNAPISFQAKKIKIVPQSTQEAELAIYAAAARDLKFIVQLLGSDGLQKQDFDLPITIYCDNSAAVDMIKKPGATARTRHYERWLLYAREQHLDNISSPVWIDTNMMIGDIFTKPLDKTKFLHFRKAMLGY